MYGRMGELLLILLIALVLFGAGKIPKIMGDIGKGIKSLREGLRHGEKENGSDAKDI